MPVRSFIAAALLVTTASAHAATVYSFDIDSNAGGPIATAPGWTSYPMGSTGNGTPVEVDGISFSVGSADGSRTRTGLNDLTRDFAFDDGAGQALIFFFGGAGDLAAGLWQVEVWAHDNDFVPLGNQIVGYRTNGAETEVTNTAASHPTDPIATFTFESDGVSAYDVYLRENNANNRSRLNAVRLTSIPEPSVGVLGLLACALGLRRRR